MRALIPLLLAIIGGGQGAAGQAATAPTLAQVLASAAAHVQEFEARFALAIGDERYEQHLEVRSIGRIGSDADPAGTRVVESEVLFLWIPQEQLWLAARNARLVDGDPVRDSAGQLQRAFGIDDGERRARLGRLRDESARFNIGRIRRNFGDPTFALQFAAARLQGRFRWELKAPARVNDRETRRIDYHETARPTLIRRGRTNLPATGSLWVDVASGAIVRSRLYVADTSLRTRANIDVDYRADDNIGTWVPSRMVETYEQRQVLTLGTGLREERIHCEAVYSNYRRFDTSVRVLP